VFITVDTLRADHLGCYGYDRDTSAGIDALADGSIVFERCLAPMATTLPSHVSLLTGTYPFEHGVLANVGTGGRKFIPRPKLKTFAQFARERGYRTAAFVSAAPLKKNDGISAGFDGFVEPPTSTALLAQETIPDAVAWVNRNSDAPFFLWVHLWDPHSPYTPPVPYDRLYRTDSALKTEMARRGVGGSALRRFYAARLTNAYDGEIRYVDDWIGVLLARLGEDDLRDRTAVMLAGDHGEALGQHGEWEHGCVHESQLEVPLIMRVPGQTPRRVGHTLSLVDAFPTLLGLLGTPWPDLLEQFSGVDVLAEGFEPRPVFAQRETIELSDRHIHGYSYVLSTDRWKLVHELEGRDHLYDLAADPHELQDRSADEPDVVAALRRQLLDVFARQREKGEALGEPDAPEAPQMDPDQLDALRSLGYVD
jgi:arylsulfatase A-like enzyme